MSTVILFSTRHGATKKAAEYINSKIPRSILVNLKENTPNISGFDNIVLGGSVYMGRLPVEMKTFFEENREILKNKGFFIFISCGVYSEFNKVLRDNLPLNISSFAKEIYCVGGEVMPGKLGFFERIAYILASSKLAGTNFAQINYEALDKLIEDITNSSKGPVNDENTD